MKKKSTKQIIAEFEAKFRAEDPEEFAEYKKRQELEDKRIAEAKEKFYSQFDENMSRADLFEEELREVLRCNEFSLIWSGETIRFDNFQKARTAFFKDYDNCALYHNSPILAGMFLYIKKNGKITHNVFEGGYEHLEGK